MVIVNTQLPAGDLGACVRGSVNPFFGILVLLQFFLKTAFGERKAIPAKRKAKAFQAV